ncbi:enoyl-CoA hydratase-related protein [Sulfoacidibacillus thermotolerans]|uniref:2-(1,2-epoxy-1,2-dihydrophenyl)acetyl-CoA isomerase n=1 Tax=Sulfoacidibacillus thermotolerans TaxID=1765684 RepID=A0A2U3D785_SULT2|nr:enoyl-CoA hydratase-related protein [Sulfoacidibacillus thermotolerans]PWI57113.1 2-(1,2-epoxy-1,2-dihydrophenyl)acetyl-CoA isomerase [Sulfoacidibacillus thermotolerans]
MYETLSVTYQSKVAKITLQRPEKLNALSLCMRTELQQVMDEIAKNREVRAVLLTGAGKAFCVGQDLEEIRAHGEIDYGELLSTSYNPLIQQMMNLNKPILCAVNGVAAGAGVSLALACDFKIASQKARFIQSFVNIGLVPDSGMSWLLPRAIGLTRALELAMFGGAVSAQEAVQLGFINRVVEPEQLEEQSIAAAEQLANLPTEALGYMKLAFYRGQHFTLEESLAYEAKLQSLAGKSVDHQEGMRAFWEKRAPQFRGYAGAEEV